MPTRRTIFNMGRLGRVSLSTSDDGRWERNGDRLSLLGATYDSKLTDFGSVYLIGLRLFRWILWVGLIRYNRGVGA